MTRESRKLLLWLKEVFRKKITEKNWIWISGVKNKCIKSLSLIIITPIEHRYGIRCICSSLTAFARNGCQWGNTANPERLDHYVGRWSGEKGQCAFVARATREASRWRIGLRLGYGYVLVAATSRTHEVRAACLTPASISSHGHSARVGGCTGQRSIALRPQIA